MTVKDRPHHLIEQLPDEDLEALARMIGGRKSPSGNGPSASTEEAPMRSWAPGETIPLFDAQAGFGGANKGETTCVAAEECLRSMERLEIRGALVRTEPDALDVDPLMSNDILIRACEGHEGLVPCPVALPAAGGDEPPEAEQVDRFIRCGAGAVAIRPAHDDWQFLPFVYDPLLRALAERRLPLFCVERHVSQGQVAEVARKYPELPIILANVSYRSQRTLVPLLAAYPNVHLSLGSNFTVHLGIEQMVGRVGPEQLLFGTGFPAAEPMMAVTQLLYAEISDEEKALIGAGNLERLLAGVKR